MLFRSRKVQPIMENSARVLAMEYLCAAQGIDMNSGTYQLGRGTSVAYSLLRQHVPKLTDDRVLYPEMETAFRILTSGRILTSVISAGITIQ